MRDSVQMTWQKVIAVKGSKEAKFRVVDGKTPDEVDGMEPSNSPSGEIEISGLFLLLESSSGNQYQYSMTMQPEYAREMAEDMSEVIEEGDIWAKVSFEGENRVMYWAKGAPWENGEIHDDYGFAAH